MWINTWVDSGRESYRIVSSSQFESLLWSISSGFPSANCFNLPGSQSIFDIFQDPPMCELASLSQDGFY